MPRFALHWKILIGLALGAAVGILVNLTWGPATWAQMGVTNPIAFEKGIDHAVVAVLPEGMSSVAELDPADPSLKSAELYHLSDDQIERFGLETVPANENPSAVAYVGRFVGHLNQFVGRLFVRSLRFIAVPLVLFSLIVGASSLNDIRKLGRIGLRTVILYLSTTAIAITIGLVLANTISPGTRVSAETRDGIAAKFQTEAAAKVEPGAQQMKTTSDWDRALDVIPKNPFTSLAQTQMLQIVFTALIIGIGLTLIPEQHAKPVMAVCDGMTRVVIKLVQVGMYLAPYAVFALISDVVAKLGFDMLQALIVYALVVLLGLLIMMLVVYPTFLKLFGGVGYRRFFGAIAPAQLLAFSSSSSAATLPVTMKVAEERLGIKDDVSSFVLPLGATINMDGTALYQGVATLFVAQLFGHDLNFAAQISIILLATAASIGTAAVPSAGLVMLVIVFEQVGMGHLIGPGIAILFGVDRIIDMCRTSCNVTGDLMVATVVASREGDLLDEEEVERRLAKMRSAPIDENP
ncbi:MAG: dicarboxylate/amino acid:cation symporter [Planctomycetes bacterium]|nr:dicarboxylate/amino acid:cation symporter [Planctomycetota bacterium]